MALEVDDHLGFQVLSPEALPLIFEPKLDWGNFHAANIVHDY
jgi:hypothetical protein